MLGCIVLLWIVYALKAPIWCVAIAWAEVIFKMFQWILAIYKAGQESK